LISTPLGELTDSAPLSYQIIGGERVPVESSFALLDGGAGCYGFKVGTDYDPRYPLVVDPGLAYSTFLNGTAFDFGRDIKVDQRGNAYVMGRTASPDFPTTPAAFDVSPNGLLDAFVAKLDPSGSKLLYSTFLGGTNDELGESIAIDRSGSAYVTGPTASPEFPTTPGVFDRDYNGGTDAFATKLDSSGSKLLYSTFFGGTALDYGRDIAVDRRGNAYVTGRTASSDFPTTPGAFDPTFNLGDDAFVTKFALGQDDDDEDGGDEDDEGDNDAD
jgi:hypothetical protein